MRLHTRRHSRQSITAIVSELAQIVAHVEVSLQVRKRTHVTVGSNAPSRTITCQQKYIVRMSILRKRRLRVNPCFCLDPWKAIKTRALKTLRSLSEPLAWFRQRSGSMIRIGLSTTRTRFRILCCRIEPWARLSTL